MNFNKAFSIPFLLLILISCDSSQKEDKTSDNLNLLFIGGDQFVRQRASQGPIPLVASCQRETWCTNEYFLVRLGRFSSSCGEQRSQNACTNQGTVGVCRVRTVSDVYTDFLEYVYYSPQDTVESARANCDSIRANQQSAKEVVFESDYREKKGMPINP